MLLIGFWQISHLLKREEYREILFFSLLWGLAFLYASLVIYRIPVPNPVDIIMDVISLIRDSI